MSASVVARSLSLAASDAEQGAHLLRDLAAGRGTTADLVEAGLALQRATRALEQAWGELPGVLVGGRG
jgi:hypothetical protein